MCSPHPAEIFIVLHPKRSPKTTLSDVKLEPEHLPNLIQALLESLGPPKLSELPARIQVVHHPLRQQPLESLLDLLIVAPLVSHGAVVE